MHRSSPIFWFAFEDHHNQVKLFQQTKTHVLWEAGTRERKREEQNKKVYNCLDLCGLPLFLSGVLSEKVGCTAEVVDGYSAIVFSMWCWSCCFCGLVNSCILRATIALSVLMMKTFPHKNLNNCSLCSQSSWREEHPK